MKGLIKTLVITFIILTVFTFLGSQAIAQTGFGQQPLWFFSAFNQQPLQVPTISPTTNDLLIDNFEYWDSPYNHGWTQIEPPYPTYGYGMGYATTFNTVLDLQEGSRVLDVYRPSSVFLLGPTPLYPYARHAIRYPCSGCMPNPLYNPDVDPVSEQAGISLVDYPVISFKFRAPLSIEWFDIFEFRLYYTCPPDPYGNYIRVVPLQGPPCAGCGGGYNIVAEQNGVYTVTIGREFLDGTWHVVYLDIPTLLDTLPDNVDHSAVTRIYALEASGQMFRLDDIAFRPSFGHEHLDYPDLFEMGPLFAQIFEPYRYLFIADYAGASITAQHPHDPNTEHEIDSVMHLMLHPELYLTDPNDIWAAWLEDLVAAGVITDPTPYQDANLDDPNDADLSTVSGFARTALASATGYPSAAFASFSINPGLPVFSDPNLRFGGHHAASLRDQGTLGWNTTIGGYGSNGVEAEMLSLLPVNPYDGMPTYIPAYYDAIDAIELYGKAHFGPQVVFALEGALYNAGMLVWPNIVSLDYTPQVFEDIILTIEVTNGVHSDVRTFPISVVNYPVENYPPVLQLDIDDQLFRINDLDPHANEYVMIFVDPDSFIFSLAGPGTTGTVPATTHTPSVWGMFRTDQDTLTYTATLSGLPAYNYGPWMQSIINPVNGLINFNPQFEGAFDLVVTCADAYGTFGIGEITIFAVQPGTWLNHPPIILGGPTQPVTLKAGEEFILHEPNFSVEDPDGDEIYASCNIGSCGRDPHGHFIWTYQSNFTGMFMVEIIFYDIRGGYAIMEFFVDVKPWWSY